MTRKRRVAAWVSGMVLLGVCALPAGRVTVSGCIRHCDDGNIPAEYQLCVVPSGKPELAVNAVCDETQGRDVIEACAVGEQYPDCAKEVETP